MFYDERHSKITEACHLEPGLHSFITVIVEAMNTLIQDRNNYKDNCFLIKISRVTQKKVYLANEKSSVAMFCTDWGHIFGGDVRNDLGIFICGKGSHEPTFAYDIVRIHSLIAEYNIVGDTKTLLLRCFTFISKLKSGDIINTGQYMSYQTYFNLQFKRLLKNSFYSIHLALRDTYGEKIPFVSVAITQLVLLFRKVSDFHLYWNLCVKWWHQTLLSVPTTKVWDVKEGVVLELLRKLLGEPPFLSWKNSSSQLQDAWALIYCNLQCQR